MKIKTYYRPRPLPKTRYGFEPVEHGNVDAGYFAYYGIEYLGIVNHPEYTRSIWFGESVDGDKVSAKTRMEATKKLHDVYKRNHGDVEIDWDNMKPVNDDGKEVTAEPIVLWNERGKKELCIA